MTAPPVALAADPVVPQRDRLLDADAIGRRIAAGLGSDGVAVGSCRVVCVNYRPGKRVRGLYVITVGGRELRFGASTFRDHGRAERAYRRACETVRDSGRLSPVMYDAELVTVFWTFPHDRKIEHLVPVAGAHADLGRLVGGRWATSRLVNYNPETSAVVRCHDGQGRVTAYAKVHGSDDGEHAHHVHDALFRLARGSRLRLARPVAYSSAYRTEVVEPVTGTEVSRLDNAARPAGLHAYGVALARLHTLPVDGIGPGRRDALDRLAHRVGGVRAVRPDLDGQVTELLGELHARWAAATAEAVPVHGDTHDDNAIMQPGGVTLIDFERACAGAPAGDLAGLLGLLRYRRSLGLVTVPDARTQADGFTAGYASVRPLPHSDVLRTHEAAALAERAFRAVTRLNRPVLPHIPRLLAEARELLP